MINNAKNSERIHFVEEEYRKFILNDVHPCIMAKSLFKMDNYHLKTYESMSDAAELKTLMYDIKEYINQYDFSGNSFESFLASFPNEKFDNEKHFEQSLWEALQQLHKIDDQPWDQSVSEDPENSKFSFSIAGKAFYVIGLHPGSSRIARQAPYPTLVFNLHRQFDKLREMGTYQAVRDIIRKNDESLQGEINPMLRDFGADSEAKQYSGRKVDGNWKCPFHKSAS